MDGISGISVTTPCGISAASLTKATTANYDNRAVRQVPHAIQRQRDRRMLFCTTTLCVPIRWFATMLMNNRALFVDFKITLPIQSRTFSSDLSMQSLQDLTA